MIGIPPASAPPALAYVEQSSPLVRRLLEYCRSAMREQRWNHARLCAQDVIAICKETGDHMGEALALIHLADFYCEVGELGEAIERCAIAYQLFRQQAAPVQRHNEAVAAYALGLLSELQPTGFTDALSWYQEAAQLLGRAREYWATINYGAKVRLCNETRSTIEERIERILKSRLKQPWQAAFDVWKWDSRETPFSRDKELRGYVQNDGRILIGENVYHPSPKIEFNRANYYFALPMQEDRLVITDAQAGSYLLVRQQWKAVQGSVGIVWLRGSGWVAADFKFEEGGIRFYPRRPTIIGGAQSAPGDPDAVLKGYITALLKPGSQ